MNNHLNQFTSISGKYRFLFEDCIHFTLGGKTKHVLVLNNQRYYNFLDRSEIKEWEVFFKEEKDENT